jgi:DNA modification methylase
LVFSQILLPSQYYSEYPDDLGNQESYQEYLKLLQEIFKEVYKKLRNNKYCTIIISDFTVDKQETNAHGDVINVISDIGFTFIGTIVLVQDSKVLYPFGYPYQFRINHVHQYILNFLKNG